MYDRETVVSSDKFLPRKSCVELYFDVMLKCQTYNWWEGEVLRPAVMADTGFVAGELSLGLENWSGCFQFSGRVIIPPPLADKYSNLSGGGAVFPQCFSIS